MTDSLKTVSDIHVKVVYYQNKAITDVLLMLLATSLMVSVWQAVKLSWVASTSIDTVSCTKLSSVSDTLFIIIFLLLALYSDQH